MKLPVPLSFDWDTGKTDKNKKKHGVSNAEAEEIFTNIPLNIYPDNKHSYKEKRYVAFGKTHKKILLTVVFTMRDNRIRIISARSQNKKERNAYAD